MAPIKQRHHLVEFAARYGRGKFKTFNAGAARWRADALAEDIKLMAKTQVAIEDRGEQFGPFNTLEIISYYSVALVTCLEWHARSRLVDLLVFKPSAIEPADLKNIATVALSQMVAEGATVAHLLGAATLISNTSSYIGVFDRVFKELDIQVNLGKQLREMACRPVGPYQGATLYQVVQEMFEYRHRLVHEIGLEVVGHFSIRDMWTVEDALGHAQAVTACIDLVEAHMTKSAPADFPNRLTDAGSPEDEFEKLRLRVAELEDAITADLNQIEPDNAWKDALQASRSSLEKQISFLEQADFLRPTRHLDMRRDYQIELLTMHLSFLNQLRSELLQ